MAAPHDKQEGPDQPHDGIDRSIDRDELRAIAARIRTDAWELAERWSVVSAQSTPATVPRAGEQLTRFGEIPAFLAALAHYLERLGDGETDVLDGSSWTNEVSEGGGELPVDYAPPVTDADLRAAAIEHARSRAAAGFHFRLRNGKQRFSSTVMAGYRTGNWNTCVTLRRAAGNPPMS